MNFELQEYKNMKQQKYRAIVSSDWNQCLAPCGPFDPIIYNYPDLSSVLTIVFKEYTSNVISLGTASERIQKCLPEPFSMEQMDDYLDNAFVTYKGVPDLIQWCARHDILFMINTTGLLGYFQRVFAKDLLPEVPVVSANPIIQYPGEKDQAFHIYDLFEIQDKGKNTAMALNAFDVPENKMVIMGDSGGDGPHFKWGKSHHCFTIGSMTKQTLIDYCSRHKIEIDLFWGLKYEIGEKRVEEKEMQIDFMELSILFEKIFN